MLLPIILGFLAVILTCLTQSRQNGAGLKAAFVIFFVFLALRYDYGNDYMTYLDGFFEFTAIRKVNLARLHWEPGWILLNLFFTPFGKPFGFFMMVMFTSMLTCVVTYRFFRNFVPASYQWLGMFIYVFEPNFLLVGASMMRQQMAILFFLVGIEFLMKKRFFVYFLLVTAASFFHLSALVLIPVAALAFVNIKIDKRFAVLSVLMYASLYVFGEQVFAFITSMTGTMFEKYTEGYTAGAKLGTGLGLVYSIFLFVNILYFAGLEFGNVEKAGREGVLPGQVEPVPSLAARRLLFKLAILSFMITPLGFQVMMVGRINMYFAPVMIALYPIVAVTRTSAMYKLMLLGSFVAFTVFRFVMFFESPVWIEKFGTYYTIFSVQKWW